MQYPTNNNKSEALHWDRREIGGEENNQNQMENDNDLGRKLECSRTVSHNASVPFDKLSALACKVNKKK